PSPHTPPAGGREGPAPPRPAAPQPLLVVALAGGDARHDDADAGRLLATVLAVLEVDVVDDLADGVERRVVQAGALQQHLEGAAVALVGVLALEHVEAHPARARQVGPAGHELEARARIDEAADQPGRGHAVDLHGLARHP